MKLARYCDGLGDQKSTLIAYMANRPQFEFALQHDDSYQLQDICPLIDGEIAAIGNACGNGWRKVFNVYAKLLYALPREIFPFAKDYGTWQQYRDAELLRSDSNTALIFDAFSSSNTVGSQLSLIMGKTYAKSLSLPKTLIWQNEDFAIDVEHKIIVCPYFDYRQLSNAKIAVLVELIKRLVKN